jgi:polyisoprenoid-binding protein YceI
LSQSLRSAALAVLAAVSSAGLAHAACPTPLPPGVSCGAPDAKLAPAGSYKADPNHTAVVARVHHLGYSLSVFRFGKVSATLGWDPAAPDASKLSAAVDTASIETPVPGFPEELSGDKYLKSKAFPQATFVSTSFQQRDPTHGRVTGDFTLLGVTHPLSFDVELIGAGKGFGAPRIGVEGRAMLDPKAYPMSPFFLDPIELVIDSEFVRTP